jgi:hypothetical protein
MAKAEKSYRTGKYCFLMITQKIACPIFNDFLIKRVTQDFEEWCD